MQVDATTTSSVSNTAARRPKKKFVDMDYREQLLEQIPDTEKDREAFKELLPVESLHPRTSSGFKPRMLWWNNRKKGIAEKLLEEIKQTWPTVSNAAAFPPTSGYDDDDDDILEDFQNEVMGSSGGPRDPILFEKLQSFVLALPTCHLLTIGFDFSGSGEEICFCPCHHQQCKQWRAVALVDVENPCTNHGRFDTPNALMDHLGSMKSCKFHQYTKRYLEELYSDWHVSEGLKHKGLYGVGSDDYIKAALLEQKHPDR